MDRRRRNRNRVRTRARRATGALRHALRAAAASGWGVGAVRPDPHGRVRPRGVGLAGEELLAQLAGDGAAAAAASEPEDAAVRASLEERIPQRDSWKPFWARGLDMVGYSINGLRTSTLPFEVTGTERSTQMLRLGFDRDETTRLLDVSLSFSLTFYFQIANTQIRSLLLTTLPICH